MIFRSNMLESLAYLIQSSAPNSPFLSRDVSGYLSINALYPIIIENWQSSFLVKSLITYKNYTESIVKNVKIKHEYETSFSYILFLSIRATTGYFDEYSNSAEHHYRRRLVFTKEYVLHKEDPLSLLNELFSYTVLQNEYIERNHIHLCKEETHTLRLQKISNASPIESYRLFISTKKTIK